MSAAWVSAPASGLVIAVLVAGWRAKAMRSAWWAAAALSVQAASLLLTRAGPLVGYQHLLAPGEWRARPLAGLIVVAVAAATVWGLLLARRERVTGVRWPWLAAFAAGLLLAAAPSEQPVSWARELVMAAGLQVLSIACVGLAARALPDELARRAGQRAAQWLDGGPGGTAVDGTTWVLAAFVTVVAAVLSLASYRAVPHVPDEIAYLIQARYFAEGMPWMPPPPVPGAFDTFLLEADGSRWFSVFPPGWPLVLAAGVRLGVPWLVNPVLGGLCVLLTALLVQELADRRTARLASLLLAVSPWHLFLAMSYMSHTLSLVLALVTALGAARAWRTGSWRAALAAGLSLGVLGMSRPLEGVAVGALAGIPILVAAIRRSRWPAVVAGAAGAMVTGGLGLWYNAALTGSALVFPAERYFDREFGTGTYSIGFGPTRGVGWRGLDPFPGHGAIDVVVNTVLNGFMVNVDLFGWATGSLAIVLAGAALARRRLERLMVVSAAVVIAVHAAYWFSGGPDFGARYWYLIIVPCVVLTGRALESASAPDDAARGRVTIALGLLVTAALVLFVPWRAADKYANYRGVRADLVSWRHEERFRNALVLVAGDRHPDWAGGVIANDVIPGKSAAPVFAWDRDPATRRAVLERYPEREVWLVRGPSLTRRGYEVERGPIHPDGRVTLLQH